MEETSCNESQALANVYVTDNHRTKCLLLWTCYFLVLITKIL